MPSFDIEAARGRFPALLNSGQVYMDNAGGSQTLDTVIEAIQDYLSSTNVQLGASYAVGQRSTALYDAGYDAAADYINASPDEIVLGSSTTQLFRNLSYALEFEPGSEIVVSQLDHEANIAPWVDLARRQKLELKWWVPKTKENPKLEALDLKELMSEKTKLVTCTHASNILGTIHDIKAIAAQVHTVPGALLCVDAVAYAPHRAIDVKNFGADYYCFSWYKVYGPHISMLYASPQGLKAVRSLGHKFNPSETLEDKLGLAGSCYELTASLPEVVAYFAPDLVTSWTAIAKHEEELQSTLLAFLGSRKDVTIIGEKEADSKLRVATVSFIVENRSSRDVVEHAEELSQGQVGIRWGTFYSVRLAEEILKLDPQQDGVVRISLVHYNSVDEVNRLIVLLLKVLGSA
ncbi:PLP-dependent transferase-1 [Coleophoma cylindrospora]|uniref:PLP-dependent transferase-1 n=1 Tax=Coleophoma cylindrospora TaxID=1849047 RepID=A0A3D8SDK0_9HELO|nr:PLP-dependent transferase-1 [Coleophoma cylindrospora]